LFKLIIKNKEQNNLNLYHEKIKNRIKNKIKNGKKVNVLFFVIHSSVWQYEMLYQRYYFDNIFDPTIVVIPYVMYDKKVMINDMNQTYQYFKNKKYNVVKTYDEKNDRFLDVKKVLQPDIIFFTNPHKITKDEYYIFNYYKEFLTCYVPYGIMTANLQDSQYNQSFHNLVWKNFYETSIHKEIAQKYADNKGENVVVTGYPKCDVFLNISYKPLNVWKNTGQNLKKIIWATKGIFSFSYVPLQIITYISLFVFFISLIAILYQISIRLLFPNTTPKGLTTVLVSILFIGSIQLLGISILGEYIGKIFEEVKQRPKYIVKSIIMSKKGNKIF